MARLGLCSVTFRALPPAAVLAHCAAAGLAAVEWAADGHAPPGDPALRDLGRATADAGLTVASYGSYLRLGCDPPERGADGPAVLAAAVALGAPRVRVWAGALGSAAATPDDRARVTRAARELAARAADAGVTIALEFHGGTLTDTVASTLALLADVDRPALRTYWQPPLDAPDAEALAGLDVVLPHLAGVHAFSWWPGSTRRPLRARADLWAGVGDRLRERPVDVLLEFVPDDDPTGLPGEADALRSLLARGVSRPGRP